MRAVEGIDNLRELLNAALETNLLIASIQQNDVTKKLAGWGASLAVPPAIAGIHGHEFQIHARTAIAPRLSGHCRDNRRYLRLSLIPPQARWLAVTGRQGTGNLTGDRLRIPVARGLQ